MDQPKIERVLRLMTLMSGSVEYTVDELADKLDTSYRSIYRYVDTFKACGFAVEKVHGNVYRLAKMSPRYPDLDKLVYFSEEEAYLVNHLIDRLDPTNALKAGLQRKLAAIYSSTSIADYIDKRSNAANVESLSRAVREKKAVRLLRYESGHSGQIRDRHVEPFGFTTNFIDVWAFDLEDGRNKIFKISRMEEVQVLEEEAWTREAEHERLGMDVFRMAGRKERPGRRDPDSGRRAAPRLSAQLSGKFPKVFRSLTRPVKTGTYLCIVETKEQTKNQVL